MASVAETRATGAIERLAPTRTVEHISFRREHVLIYAFLMDYYIAGLTAGATKG